MIFGSEGRGYWILLILAGAVIVGYFGILGHVHDAHDTLEGKVGDKIEQYEKKAGQTGKMVRLARQPKVVGKFADPAQGLTDAYTVLFLFIFLSPIALFMVVTLAVFVLVAIAGSLGPFVGGEQIAMLILVVGLGVVGYVERDLWIPHAAYFLGLFARAFVVATQSTPAA